MGVQWVKWKIAEEWAESLPDRYDPAKAAEEVDSDGVISNYENSYDMHHKIVEATPQEIKALLERQEKAERGLIVWDEEKQQLRELANHSQEKMVEDLELEVWTDGSTTGYGVVICDQEGRTLRQIAAAIPEQIGGERKLDHSDTEYMAVIMGLHEANHLGATKVKLYCDALFLVGHMTEEGKPRKPEMIRYNAQAVEAAAEMDVEYIKIAGKENPADGLSKMFASK